MNLDDMVARFRAKYPHSTEQQVELYADAVRAEIAHPPQPEPDVPMPLISVPEPRPKAIPQTLVTTYTVASQPRARPKRYFHNFGELPLEMKPRDEADRAAEMRDILLGRHGFKSGLTPAQRHRLETTEMTENDMLAMLVGAPSAREFADLA